LSISRINQTSFPSNISISPLLYIIISFLDKLYKFIFPNFTLFHQKNLLIYFFTILGLYIADAFLYNRVEITENYYLFFLIIFIPPEADSF